MENTACKHKQMPYKVHILNLFHLVENDTHSISNAADYKQCQTARRCYAQHRLAAYKNRPAIIT